MSGTIRSKDVGLPGDVSVTYDDPNGPFFFGQNGSDYEVTPLDDSSDKTSGIHIQQVTPEGDSNQSYLTLSEWPNGEGLTLEMNHNGQEMFTNVMPDGSVNGIMVDPNGGISEFKGEITKLPEIVFDMSDIDKAIDAGKDSFPEEGQTPDPVYPEYPDECIDNNLAPYEAEGLGAIGNDYCSSGPDGSSGGDGGGGSKLWDNIAEIAND